MARKELKIMLVACLVLAAVVGGSVAMIARDGSSKTYTMHATDQALIATAELGQPDGSNGNVDLIAEPAPGGTLRFSAGPTVEAIVSFWRDGSQAGEALRSYQGWFTTSGESSEAVRRGNVVVAFTPTPSSETRSRVLSALR